MSTRRDEPAPTRGPPPNLDPHGRYAPGEYIGGTWGEVWRVYDRDLMRPLVMKLLPRSLEARPGLAERFIEEARVTAWLDHPGVVPVLELGRLPDGQLFYTMKEVRGRTLQAVIEEAHAAGLEPARLRRLVGLFLRACEAVACAHARGVLHLDLKPQNIMVGDFGEVRVVDWGLARVLGRGEAGAPAGGTPTARDGEVVGTPAYMAPEQARGDARALGPPADVHALGCVLYTILEGRPPIPEADPEAALARALAGPPASPAEDHPEDLRRCVERATRPDPRDRFADAAALAAELSAWLDGARRRERALALVAQALARGPAAAAARARADALRARAAAEARAVPPLAPEERKRPLWALEDEVALAEAEAAREELATLQDLRAALGLEPQLQEAHDELADHYLRRHAEAEARGSPEAQTLELMLRAHGARRHARYLRGEGLLALRPLPAEATWTLSRLVMDGRRLVPRPEREGRGPIDELPLPVGSWLVELAAEGHHPALAPALIERAARWDGGALALLPEGSLGPEDLYVPGGPFLQGGDAEAYFPLPATRPRLPGFVVRRHPVTQAEFIDFLNDLLDQGREEEALRHAPRERAARPGATGALILGRDAGGRFHLAPDAEGDLWQPDWPVMCVDWHGARAYAAWRAARDGLPWRLPSEQEWEKAARGVDGRIWPWGNHLDPTWCCYKASHAGRPLPASVHAFPVDRSIYGLRGAAGNVREWCADLHSGAPDDPDAERVVRGGAFFFSEVATRLGCRFGLSQRARSDTVGFRLARSL